VVIPAEAGIQSTDSLGKEIAHLHTGFVTRHHQERVRNVPLLKSLVTSNVSRTPDAFALDPCLRRDDDEEQ
jgi:hypothetical protein